MLIPGTSTRRPVGARVRPSALLRYGPRCVPRIVQRVTTRSPSATCASIVRW